MRAARVNQKQQFQPENQNYELKDYKAPQSCNCSQMVIICGFVTVSESFHI